MRDRQLPLTALASALGLASFFAVTMTAQAPATGTKPAAPSTAKPAATAKPATGARPAAAAAIRTPWGDPDLQGTWFVTEDVPLERSAANANREFLTDEEVAAANKRKAEAEGRNSRSGDAANDVSGAYNAAFNSILKTGKRTSRVIDPPDGRIPPTVAAAARGGGAPGGAPGAGGRGAGGGRGQGGPGLAPGAGGGAIAPRGGGGGGGRGANVPGGGNDNPEQIAQSPRCLGVTLPFLPQNTAFAQGTVMRIAQSPKSIAIYMEDDHSGGGNRIVNIDKRAHPSPSMKLTLGDSRGRWEGSTLVVETTNFAQPFAIGGARASADVKLVERYTRTSATGLRRDFVVDDPKTWTRPFTIMIEFGKASDERHMIFESACHEGNYGMTGILVGSRLEEKAAAAAGK